MDPLQRVYDPEETLRVAIESMLAGVWTALPCIVQSFNAVEWTISAQPTITARLPLPDGTWQMVKLPLLTDVPVVWLGGGGVTGIYPISPNDEALVVFSARCIDAWWAAGGVQDPPDLREHDLSDGFAFVGVRSRPRVFEPPAGVAGLVTDDGQTFITLNPTTKAVAAQASGGINLNGVLIDSGGNITGAKNITASGTVAGQTDVVAGTAGSAVSVSGHQHTSAASGSPTSAPIPGT